MTARSAITWAQCWPGLALRSSTEELEAAKGLDPGSTGIRYELARALQQKTETKRAKEELATIQRLESDLGHGDEAAAQASRGNQLLIGGEAREAAEEYRKALATNPNDARAHYNLALALSRVGDREGHLRELDAALALDPKMELAHNELGLTHLADGRMEQAERNFRTALALNAQFAEAKNNLGVLYMRQGKAEEAGSLFRQATEDNPGTGKRTSTGGWHWRMREATLRRRRSSRPPLRSHLAVPMPMLDWALSRPNREN